MVVVVKVVQTDIAILSACKATISLRILCTAAQLCRTAGVLYILSLTCSKTIAIWVERHCVNGPKVTPDAAKLLHENLQQSTSVLAIHQ